MKIRLTLLIPALFFAIENYAQKKEIRFSYESISIPPDQFIRNWFLVSEQNQLFIAHQGGIYLPADSAWFIPPSRDLSFTSFAPSLKDTAMFVLANSKKFSELYYLKSSVSESIKRLMICQLRKGMYNLIMKNNICYVWGYSNNRSKIGIVVGQEIKWILDIPGVIRQVHVNQSSEIYFALNKSIYRLNDQKIALTLDKTISGFCFDDNNNLITSSEAGIGIKKEDKLMIIATGISGLLEYQNEQVFVLSNKAQQIVKISKK